VIAAECNTHVGRILPRVRARRLLTAALVILVSQACLVVSLQPVYEPDIIAFDPGLVGAWTMGEDGVTVTFERGEWHSYHMTLEQRDDRTRLSARLTRVGELTYLDISPLDGTDLPALALPVHAVYRVELKGDELSLSDLNFEVFERRVREGTATLPAVIDARKNVVITASTAELRRWLVDHAAEEGLFDPPTTFTRVPPPASTITPR
jgi:hypothetical protein